MLTIIRKTRMNNKENNRAWNRLDNSYIPKELLTCHTWTPTQNVQG